MMKINNKTSENLELPSLKSLRYFEVAARHRSFTGAADELRVGQSAVSHRIKALEEQIGYKLFTRSKRGVELTDQGEFYFNEISRAFERITAATKQLNPSVGSSVVNLTVTPLISSRWLIPRMQNFSANHPNVHLNLNHSEELITSKTIKGLLEDQAVISYRRRVPAQWRQELLFSAGMAPLCNPSLLPQGRTELDPSDLLSMPLMHEKDRRWWTEWFRMAGFTSGNVPVGPTVDAPMSLIESALNGQAVVLSPPILFQDYIEAGLLVLPVGTQIQIPIDYYLLTPEKSGGSSSVRKFAKWVREQARTAAG